MSIWEIYPGLVCVDGGLVLIGLTTSRAARKQPKPQTDSYICIYNTERRQWRRASGARIRSTAKAMGTATQAIAALWLRGFPATRRRLAAKIATAAAATTANT